MPVSGIICPPDTAFAAAVAAVRTGERTLDASVADVVGRLTDPELLWLLDGDLTVRQGLREMSERYNKKPFQAGRIDRLGIPGIRFTDGPRGVALGASTAFPVAIARAATWDPDVERAVADVIGAEARAQGGIIGAYAIVTVSDGKIKLTRTGSDAELNGFGPIRQSSFPEDLVELWGVDMAVWQDINASAHTPYTGQVISEAWKNATGQTIDGVIFVGQGTVAHLAAAGGDIKVRDNDLNEQNIVDFLTKGIYAKYPNVGEKNAVVTEVMKVLFKNLTTNKIDTSAFFASLADEKTGDRLVAWSSNKEIQQRFAQEGVAGIVSEKWGPNALVTVNNAGGNKLEAYANFYTKYTQGKCGAVTFDGYYARESEVEVRVSNKAPKSGLPAYVTPRLDEDFGFAPRPKGSNRELISIYGPVGSEDAGFFVDGKEYFASAGIDRSHPVWVFDVELQPGESKVIKVKFLEPIADQNGELLKGKPTLTPPVLLNPARVVVNAGPTCSLPQ
jgi:hypothetical protein